MSVPVPLGRRAAAEGVGTAALVALLGPVSGAHVNPAVTLGAWAVGRRARG